MFRERSYGTLGRFAAHGFQACGAVRAMKHSAQLKVRFCGNCWKEKSVCTSFHLTHKSHPPLSVKTNHELKGALIPNKWNKGFGLDLLPSADDGELKCTVL